jgi:ribosomal protein L34E
LPAKKAPPCTAGWCCHSVLAKVRMQSVRLSEHCLAYPWKAVSLNGNTRRTPRWTMVESLPNKRFFSMFCWICRSQLNCVPCMTRWTTARVTKVERRWCRAYFDAAQEQAWQHRHETSLNLIDSGLGFQPQQADRHSLNCLKADLLLDTGDVESSIGVYQQVERNADGEQQFCDAWMSLAANMRVKTQYAEGLALLEKAEPVAIRNHLTSTLSRLHHLRGNLSFSLGKADECRREHLLTLARSAACRPEGRSARTGKRPFIHLMVRSACVASQSALMLFLDAASADSENGPGLQFHWVKAPIWAELTAVRHRSRRRLLPGTLRAADTRCREQRASPLCSSRAILSTNDAQMRSATAGDTTVTLTLPPTPEPGADAAQ